MTADQQPTVPTSQAVWIVAEVAGLLFAGTWGVMYAVSFALWLYWR